MSGSANLRVAARKIRVWAKDATDPAALSKLLADGAKQALRDAIASGDAPNEFEVYVDGKRGAKEEAVTPDGYIMYKFNYMPDVLEFLIEFLKLRSPSGTRNRGAQGKFKDSFMIAPVGGRPVLAKNFKFSEATAIPYFIYNDQVYARRVDTQFVGTKKLKFKVPPGLFQDGCVAIKNRYGGFITARRLYTIAVPNPYIIKHGLKKGDPVETPAILISPRVKN